MEAIDIYKFRGFEENLNKIEVNVEYISKLLKEKGLVKKSFGLCAEPFEGYFEVCNTDKRSVSCVKNPLNNIWVNIANHTTMRKKTFYHNIDISCVGDFYYLCCLAQTSYYIKNVTGPDHVVYKVKESELEEVLNKIFEDVEPIK